MIKKHLLILTVAIFSIQTEAQNIVTSLNKQFQKHLNSDKDSSLYFLKQVQKEAVKNKTYEDEYLNLKGLYAYYWENDIKGADKLFSDALQLAKQNNDTVNYYAVVMNKSLTERDFGNTDKAFQLLVESSAYYQKKNNQKTLGGLYNNMALIMLYAKKEDEAEKYFKLALPLLEKYRTKRNVAATECALATTLFTLKKNSEGLIYLNAAKKLAIEIGDSLILADCYKEEGIRYSDDKSFTKAIECFESAKTIYASYGVAEPLGVVYTSLYTCYAGVNNMQQAKRSLDSGLYYVNLLGQEDLLISNKWFEADYYKRTGDYKKAYDLFEDYVSQKDSVFGKENTDKINELNIKYKTTEKDNELLKNRVDIAEKGFLIEKQKTRIYFVSALFILALLIVVIASYFIRRQRRLNKELTELNTFKNKVISIISHDLRNPLVEIANNSKEENVKDKAVGALDILESLLGWSYPQINKSQLKPVRIILSEILDDVREQVFYLTNGKHQNIVQQIDETFTFMGDNDTTLIILRNLLTNASKYSNESSNIYIINKGNEISIVNHCSKNIIPGAGIGFKLCEDLAKQNNYKLSIDINSEKATASLQV